jgi:hypothetical protein
LIVISAFLRIRPSQKLLIGVNFQVFFLPLVLFIPNWLHGIRGKGFVCFKVIKNNDCDADTVLSRHVTAGGALNFRRIQVKVLNHH